MFDWFRKRKPAPPKPEGHDLVVRFRFGRPIRKERPMQETSFSTIQKQLVTANFVNASNQPVAVDGAPLWEIDNSAIATLEPSPDGLSCFVVAGAPGEAFVTVRADAKLGAGEVEVSGQFKVTITEAMAVRVEFGFSAPSDK